YARAPPPPLHPFPTRRSSDLRRLLDRLLRRSPPPYPAVFRRQLPSIITPRDFDLSPYFEVIKFYPVEATNFDYRRIRWEDSEARSEEHTSELQSRVDLVCRLL